jgi:7-carboxy-7-deazaguanine synthase
MSIPNTINLMSCIKTIQGEGINTGRTTTFVRTLGCNLDCSYCDTGYRPQDDRSRIPFETYTKSELITRIKHLASPHICFTGGEPLLHHKFLYDLIETLVEEKLVDVNQLTPVFTFETNGAVKIDKSEEWREKHSVAYTMDVKPFAYDRFRETYHKNLITLKPRLGDEVKMVITGEEDLVFADEIIGDYPNNQYILSPVTIVETKEFTKSINDLVTDYVMNVRGTRKNVRVGVQMHKIIDVL